MQKTTLCILIKGQPSTEVLLGYKKIGFGQGKYTGFGGKIEPGETPLAAAARELAEETGLELPPSSLTAIARIQFRFPHRPAWSQEVHVYTALDVIGQPIESDEMRPVWFTIGAIPYAEMWEDANYWLPPILAGQRFLADFTFRADNASVASVTFSPWQDI